MTAADFWFITAMGLFGGIVFLWVQLRREQTKPVYMCRNCGVRKGDGVLFCHSELSYGLNHEWEKEW